MYVYRSLAQPEVWFVYWDDNKLVLYLLFDWLVRLKKKKYVQIVLRGY